MALVLLFTAAADLAKDLAVRLGGILACVFGRGLLCGGRVRRYWREDRKLNNGT
jgi:hypothetical protein